jgi:hypothetical protein
VRVRPEVLRDSPRELQQAVDQDLHAVRARGVVGSRRVEVFNEAPRHVNNLSSAFSRLNCIVLKRLATLLVHHSQSECVFRVEAVSSNL